MSVKYILSRAGAKMGLDPSIANDRNTLLRFLNEAAEELYAQSDLTGSLMEQVFKVNGDQTISLPSCVGKIRAIREFASMQVWHINQMRPRYNQFNWTDMWRNYRLVGKRALMTGITNESNVVITVPIVEDPPIVVSVCGTTNVANFVSEQLTIDALQKVTVNAFTDISSVKKDRVNNYDVTITDIDYKTLTVIPNNMMAAMYQIIDISSCPWLPNATSMLDNYVEILYKKTLPWLSVDDDEFPAFDYDNVIVNKIMQLWAEEQEKVDVAAAYDAKATRSAARIHEDQNRATEDLVALVANPHDTLLKRIGTGLRRRYSLYSGRKF
jgi:hypothetical protein